MFTGMTIIPDQTNQQEHTPMERLIDKINENSAGTRNNELLRALQTHCHRLFF